MNSSMRGLLVIGKVSVPVARSALPNELDITPSEPGAHFFSCFDGEPETPEQSADGLVTAAELCSMQLSPIGVLKCVSSANDRFRIVFLPAAPYEVRLRRPETILLQERLATELVELVDSCVDGRW